MEAEAIRSYIKETNLTSYVEELHQNLRQVVKSKNVSSLEDTIKECLEEEKLIESNKEDRRLFQNSKTGFNSNQKYCNICKKNNHNTVQCRIAGENRRKQEFSPKVNTSQSAKVVQKLTCKAKGHIGKNA